MDTLVYLCFDFYRKQALKTRANGLALRGGRTGLTFVK